MSEETKPQWYLVQARPRQAELAVEHLERQGYCVFHPRLHVEQLRRGRPVVVEQALFPDYLFIRLQAGVDNFGPVRSTRGVAQLVGFGTVPVPFDANLMMPTSSRTCGATWRRRRTARRAERGRRRPGGRPPRTRGWRRCWGWPSRGSGFGR